MKRIVIFVLISLFSCSLFAVIHHANIRGKKVYYHRFYPNGKMEVVEHHHTAKPGTIQVAELEGANHYAVNEKHEGMDWLNHHVKQDIFINGGAAVYHKTTGEHLGLMQLHPGTYYLDMTDIKSVKAEKGYQALKDVMGNRIQLIPQKDVGDYVQIKILGPQDLKGTSKN